MELFKTVPAFFMPKNLFLQLIFNIRFRYNSIKPIEKLSRRHFINSFDDSEALGKTVHKFYSLFLKEITVFQYRNRDRHFVIVRRRMQAMYQLLPDYLEECYEKNAS